MTLHGGDVVVVVGGVIGAAAAWRCAQRSLSVTLVDPSPGTGASGTAAGMLAPVTELHFGEEALLRLNLASAARYPDFVQEVEEVSGHPTGFRRSGTLAVAWDGADVATLRDLMGLQRRLGLEVEWLTGAELRTREPALAPGIPGGVLAPGDHSIDPRRLHRALVVAAVRAGVQLHRAQAAAVATAPARVELDDGTAITGVTVLVAAGAWTPALLRGIPDVALPIRPVKGQTVRLRAAPGLIRRVTRGSVRGFPVYVVPREDGEVVVGATTEEVGFDVRHRTGAVLDLLRHAQALLPELAETEIVELSTSLRPGTPDNGPLIGPTAAPGVAVAAGHHRNGILLTPVTADAVAALLSGGPPVAEAAAFAADRWTSVEAVG